MSTCGREKARIDWKETMALLRTAPQVPPLLLEIEGVEGEKVAEKMAEAYSKLEVIGLRRKRTASAGCGRSRGRVRLAD